MSTAIATNNGGIVQRMSDELENDGMEWDGRSGISDATRAEVDIQISTAKRYPRSLRAFKLQAMEMATFDEETAAGCFYSLPRGGKPIEGPSARLAEIVLSAWGNVRSEARVVGADAKEVTAEAMTWDLEKNVAVRVQVKRRITDKYGKRFSDDMVVVTGNAACSIALRNSVFKVIPMVYTKSVYEAARQVAIGDIKTLAAKRSEMVAYFGKMGVADTRVFLAVGKSNIEEIGLEQLASLKGLATAIKDGDTNVDEAFPMPAPIGGPTGVVGLKERIAMKAAPPPVVPETLSDDDIRVDEGNNDDLDTATENLRSHIEELFSTLSPGQQKNLLAGKSPIRAASHDELEAFDEAIAALAA